jgi:hypothetical protein
MALFLLVKYLVLFSLSYVNLAKPSKNDPEDWHEESVRMRQVYGTATLTIAINTSQTLFTMKRSKEAVPEWEDIRHQCGVNSLWKIFFLKRMLESGVVGKRAWCLQERHLSPRLLHILDNGVVIFECSRAQWSTNAPNLFGLPGEATSHRKIANSKRWIDIANELKHDILLLHWHDFLREYQNRALTYNEDNLTALAGIAEYMQARTGWKYLSGIWKQDIVRGMLWESKGFEFRSEPSHVRFSRYHAPTWSWGSVSGSTRTIPEMIDNNGETIHVESWHTEKSGEDPGQHVSLVSEISIDFAPTAGPVTPLSIDSTIELRGILIEYQCIAQGGQCGLVTNLTEVGIEEAILLQQGKITFDVPSEAYDGALWCLPLVVNQFSPSSGGNLPCSSQAPSPRSCLGIGLQKVSPQLMPEEKRVGRLEGKDEAIHTFRRVGLVRLTLRKRFWVDLLPEARLLRMI